MRKVIVGLAAVVTVLAAGAVAYGRSASHPRSVQATPAAVAVNERWLLGADGKQATAGVSRLQSAGSADKVNLRDRPAGNLAGQTTGFGLLDAVDPGTEVVMKCWKQGGPGDGPSRRWFWVVESPAASPHPGRAGYVWADLVWDQIAVPECTAALTASPDPLARAEVTVARGAATTGAYFFAVALTGFPPGWHATVQCVDGSDPDQVFHYFDLVIDSSGAASRDDGCKSGDPGGHWVFVDGVQSNKVNWSMTTPARPEPARTTGTPGGAPGGDPPTSPAVAAPATRTIVVDNRVTNGATAMREDGVPAYLSTATRPACRLNGCKVDGTEMSTGATLTVVCQTRGEQMTNGQVNSTIDDGNPGLHTSPLWYGVRHDGRTTYIAEVYVRRADRGGLDLPAC